MKRNVAAFHHGLGRDCEILPTFLLAAGTLSLVIGMYLQNVLAVASGLLYGGLLSYVIATIRFWSNMDDYVRFVILGIVLAFLISLGIKKLRDE